MTHADRFSGSVAAALGKRSVDARIRFIPRMAGVLMGLVLACAIGGGLLASWRTGRLASQEQPAVTDSRQLGDIVVAVREQLADAAIAPADRLVRADSLAERFHAIARDRRPTPSSRARLTDADSRFTTWYVQARSVAQGIDTGVDSDASSGVAVTTGYRALRGQLAADVDLAERELASGVATAGALQYTTVTVLVLAGVVSSVLFVLFTGATTRAVDGSLDQTAGAIDALVAGDFSVVISDAEAGAMGRLNQSLRRMSRQLRANSETAHALADGAFRRATLTRAPADPTGKALANLTASMEAMAASAHRISRGDLTATFTPQSDEDAFGQAYAAMIRRITGVMREVESTRATIAQTVEQMRGDAAELAACTSDDADQLRRAIDRISFVAMQAQASATRSAVLEERAHESSALVTAGNSALQGSIDGVKDVLRKSAAVQSLARNAALLAVGSGTEAGHARLAGRHVGGMVEEARALATQAASAAGEITRIMIDGTESAHDSAVALDQVAAGMQASTRLVRELGAVTREQATDLLQIDESIVQMHGTTLRNAATARQLATRLDALAGHARRLDSAVRRFSRTSERSIATDVRRGPVLYRTPPHAVLAFPRLAIAGA